jgi:predicted SnoaL-like aldol condensation-catalyzing enzyme
MSVEQNKAIVRRFYDEIINRGRFEVAEEVFAVDYTNHTAGGGIGTGHDGFIEGLKACRAAFPDWTVTVNAMISEGDLVCDHVSIRATHSGQAPGGAAPTHDAVAGEAMHLWRLSNGRLAEGWILRNSGRDFKGVCGSLCTHAEMIS